jgi:DNA-directed RNA polymerase subunit RPC12/RpoP
MSQFTKRFCQNCGGGLEFETSFLQPGEQRVIQCPHCSSETILQLPVAPPPPKQKSKWRFIWWAIPAFAVLIPFLGMCLELRGPESGKTTRSDVEMLGVLVMGFLFGAFIYFLPSAIALGRKRRNAAPIIIVNIFFGWTLLGWVAALVWAISDE